MSGGSMGYLYSQVRDASFSEDTPARVAFRKHLEKVAKALRAIEWNDSGDGDEREEEYIRACLERGAVLEAAIDRAHEAHRDLQRELEAAVSGKWKIAK